MPKTKQTAQGAIFRYRAAGSTDATAWKIVHLATEYSGSVEVGTVDVSTHSTLGGVKEFITEALADAGDFTISANLNPDITSPASAGNLVTNGAHSELMGFTKTGQEIECHLAYPKAGALPTSHVVAPPTDRAHEIFNALVTGFSNTVSLEGVPTIEFTLKRTGNNNFVPGTI